MLLSAWLLWGWTVGESRNIQWLRKSCAPAFVVTALLIVAGGSAMVTRITLRQQAEDNVREILTGIHDRLQQGETVLVQEQLRRLIESDPDQEPVDLMENLPVAASALEVEHARVTVASKPSDEHRR